MKSDAIINIIKKQELANNSDVLDVIASAFYDEMISETDKELLRFAFDQNPSQESFDEFLSGLNFDTIGWNKSLLLSYIVKMQSHLKLDPASFPRLKEILHHYRLHNIKLMGHYNKLGKAWNSHGITPLIIKGGALKFLRNDLSRTMGDIDVVVPEAEFKKSAEISRSVGYDFFSLAEDVDRVYGLQEVGGNEDTLDVHSYYHVSSGEGKKYTQQLVSRARPVKIFSVNSIIPCHEDLLFIALVNLAKNIRTFSSVHGVIYNAFDCHYLINSKQNFDWNIVIENTKKTCSTAEACIAMKFINKLVPDLLPIDLFNAQVSDAEVKKFSLTMKYYYEYVAPSVHKSGQIPTSMRNESISSFLKFWFVKPWYVIPNRLRNNYGFIRCLYAVKSIGASRRSEGN